eukprot:928949-Prorocentrum_lima.AAC.1
MDTPRRMMKKRNCPFRYPWCQWHALATLATIEQSVSETCSKKKNLVRARSRKRKHSYNDMAAIVPK